MSVGEVLIAILTVVCAAAAAFVGARTATRTSRLQDAREREAKAWDRLEYLVTLACSANPTEAYVGLAVLRSARHDWDGNPQQREFVKWALMALATAPSQARRARAAGDGRPATVGSPVTRAQVLAAQLAIELQRADGVEPDQALQAVAAAEPEAD